MCRFIQRVRSQLPECDAQSLTQLALGLSVLGPKLSTGWMAAFVRALQRQPTALDLQVQVSIMHGASVFLIGRQSGVMASLAPPCQAQVQTQQPAACTLPSQQCVSS